MCVRDATLHWPTIHAGQLFKKKKCLKQILYFKTWLQNSIFSIKQMNRQSASLICTESNEKCENTTMWFTVCS